MATPLLETRLRFPEGGGDVFGPGKAELLRQIGATGSIRAAAAAMDMSYNRAWTLVRSMNRLFREPLVTSVRGGKERGGASLTACGKDVLARYTRMEAQCHRATRKEWQALSRLLRPV